MNPTLKKISVFFTLIFYSSIIGCLSVRKEEIGFAVEIKSKSPVPSISRPDKTSNRQPGTFTHAPDRIINKTTLRWTAPATNADGTPLNDLHGYTVYYGQTKNSLGDKDRKRKNVSRDDTSIVIYNLESGEWCFQVTAYDTSYNESEFSNGVCGNIQ